MGPTVAASVPLVFSAREIWRMVQPRIVRIAEVDRGDRGDGARHDFFRIDLDPQREAHEDGELGARVEAAHVFSGVGLGVALGLRGGQHGGEFGALVHLAEDEVAGAVENAFDALDAIAGQALLEAGNHGDSARDSGAIFEVSAFGRGQPFQFDAMESDELLVGRDHALAGFEGAPDPGAGGIEPAHKLHDDVGVGAEHGVDILGPGDLRAGPIHALARDAAIENVGQFQARGPRIREDARHGAAHRAEPEDGDPQRTQA